MTKSQVKSMHADVLREALAEHFEGLTEETTKKEMEALVDEHWDDWLSEQFADEDESDDEEETVPGKDLSRPNPATNLGYGPTFPR